MRSRLIIQWSLIIQLSHHRLRLEGSAAGSNTLDDQEASNQNCNDKQNRYDRNDDDDFHHLNLREALT